MGCDEAVRQHEAHSDSLKKTGPGGGMDCPRRAEFCQGTEQSVDTHTHTLTSIQSERKTDHSNTWYITHVKL